jgi:hypothetical protein
VAHARNASYLGGQDREGGSLRPARANSSEDTVPNNQSKMNWRYGSSGRAPALHMWMEP